MRQFVLLGHDVPIDGEFSLDDLAGGAGRLDVSCRSITAALLLSHDIREDVRVHLVVDDEVSIRFDGSRLRRLNPDERSTAARVRTALEHREEAIGAMPATPEPGIEVYRRGLEGTLAELEGSIVQLHEEGDPVVDATVPAEPTFVLSDHREFGDAERTLLEEHAAHRLRLGPERLHADQAITVAHHYLDTEGYERF